MNDRDYKIALSGAKYCVLFCVQAKKARAIKKKEKNAPVHTFTILDLTNSFNKALEELTETGISLQIVKNKLIEAMPEDATEISKLCNSLANRLPQKNLTDYTYELP